MQYLFDPFRVPDGQRPPARERLEIVREFVARDLFGERYHLRLRANIFDLDAILRGDDPEFDQVIETTDGRPVKRLAQGKYCIEGAGILLRSNDSTAP